MTPDEIRERAAQIAAAGDSSPQVARDPVNLPMIRNWAEAVGDENPVYVDADAARAAGHDRLVAPPAMVQVWTMRGLGQPHPSDDPLGQTMDLFDEAGYTAVVATNCEQTYHRYVRHGERLSMVTALETVAGPKRTALGEGWFMATRHTWHSGDEPVAEMSFRMLKYLAPSSAEASSKASHRHPAAAADRTDPGAEPLPAMTIEATPTFIISTALATRDFQDVHHDRDAAIAHGSKDIFVNILTDTALVQRFATDWAGPAARVRNISLRLFVPCYAYDTLVFTGAATADADGGTIVEVSGRGRLGDHVTGTVRLL